MARQIIGLGEVSISRVGLGGYELGPEPDEEPDVARAARVIEAAREAGINWLDSSENYLDKRNETVIGAALAQVDGDFLVATKVAPGAAITGGGSGFRREQVNTACRDSLGRLGRQQIDVYFLHWPDETGVPLEETWGAMSELADAGLVRAIGLSNYELEDVERCHASRPVDVVQVGLSMIDYLDARKYIVRCRELGIAATIYEPLASGILGGKTKEQILALWT
jgi:aryl-alcohol dehydrogenase-like predicted oxidoreductase